MYNIFRQIFLFSLFSFFLFFAFELIKEGFVSNYFDLNIILIIILISGLWTAYFVKL